MKNKIDFRARVFDMITNLFGETRAADHQNKSLPEPGRFEKSVEDLVDFLEHQSVSSGLLRFHTSIGRDLIVSPGVAVELSILVDTLLDLTKKKIQFLINDEIVGETSHVIGRRSYFLYTPLSPGLYKVGYQIVSASGRIVTLQSSGSMVIHVVQDAIVAAIDAALLFSHGEKKLGVFNELAQQGWQFCYTDMVEQDRSQEIREKIDKFHLPIGAVLVHPSADREFKTLNVDFQRVFATSTLRRIRANGVPLLVVISDDPAMSEVANEEHILGLNISELEKEITNTSIFNQAKSLLAEFGVSKNTAHSDRGWRLDCMTGTRPVENNFCSVEFDNGFARERLFESIQQARNSIHLQFYIFKDCRFTEHLAVHLISRARSGVQVRILVDALYSTQDLLGIKNRVVEGLKTEPNVNIVAVDPIRATDDIEAKLLKQRDHRKNIIMDGKQAFVSGRNAGDEYYTSFRETPITDWTPAERIPWLDAHVEVHGPIVAAIQHSFITAWERNMGPPIQKDDAVFPPLSAKGDCSTRFVIHNGVADSNCLAAYEAIIDSASSHLYVINDFPVIASLAGAFRRAVARGVSVFFLTGNALARKPDGSFFKGSLHRELFEYLTKHRFEQLILDGINVYEFMTPPLDNIVSRGLFVRPYVHAKMMTADGEIASVGSANLDATASYWEREAVIIIENRQHVRSVESEIQKMMQGSYKIDLDSDYWKNESRQRDIVATLWPESLLP